MDIGSIFLVLGLLVLVGLFISRPFFERPATVFSKEEHDYSALLAERDQVINALQELDFDFTLGKIPEAEYPSQRAMLLQQGAAALKKLDIHQARPGDDDVEARIEAAITARRADTARQESGRLQGAPNGSATRLTGAPDDDLETIIASRRRERSEKSAGFCPKCGRPVQKSDRFCPKCGATL